jgi:Peptidase A4 family
VSKKHMPGGLTVKTFLTSPVGFNPCQADDVTLALHGLPPRPVGNPKLLARWESVLGRVRRHIEPTFRTAAHPAIKTQEAGAEPAVALSGLYPVSTEQSGVICGADLPTPSAPINFVSGEFTVPQDGPWTGVLGVNNPVFGAIFAVSLDRFAAVPLITGVYYSEDLGPDTVLSLYNPFWAVGYDQPIVVIEENGQPISLQPGDVVSFAISVDPSSGTPVTFSFTGPMGGLSFATSLPPGAVFTGQEAAWTIEPLDNAGVGLTYVELPGTIYFSDCLALSCGGSGQGLEYKPTSENTRLYVPPPSLVQVTDIGNEVICTYIPPSS